jgi:O-acetylserine/cysteine efflux transporter
VLVKRHAEVPIFPLVVWCSLVPPLPSLLISSVYDSRSLAAAVPGASWLSLAATLYLGTLTTIFGYAAWGRLLQRHPAALVAPFALLSPCTGIVASAALLGEIFTPLRYAGMAFILVGLTVIVLPGSAIGKPSARC